MDQRYSFNSIGKWIQSSWFGCSQAAVSCSELFDKKSDGSDLDAVLGF
jgi:hypothetical protein